MLFFTLEDRYGEIEVLAFPRQYSAYAELLHADSAVYLRASVSAREDELPKLILNEAAELLENDRFSAAKEKEDVLSVSAAPVVSSSQASGGSKPRRLYLRVEDCNSLPYRKALNLAGIFEGTVETLIYDSSTGKYAKIGRVALSEKIFREFCNILGEANVKYQ